MLDNEARLTEEYAAIDNALAGDKLEAERAAIGYDEMTFEEKKAHGLLNGLDAPTTSPEEVRHAISAGKIKPRLAWPSSVRVDLDLAAYMIRNKARNPGVRRFNHPQGRL